MMKKASRGAKNVAFQAVLTAVMLLSMFLPKIGMLSFAFLPLIAVTVSALCLGFWNGVVTGVIFGVMSLVGNIAVPSSVLSPYFQNPLVSVLPRVLIGIACFMTAKGVKKVFPKCKPFWSDAAGAFVGVAVNTALVLFLMLWIYGGEGYITPAVILTIFLTNSILEICLTVAIAPLIAAALRKSSRLNS